MITHTEHPLYVKVNYGTRCVTTPQSVVLNDIVAALLSKKYFTYMILRHRTPNKKNNSKIIIFLLNTRYPNIFFSLLSRINP